MQDQLYILIEYGIVNSNRLDPYSIEYLTSFTFTPPEFLKFIQQNELHSHTFSEDKEIVHSRLKTLDEFYNALYKDVLNQKYYMICCIDKNSNE
jgi:hypothetical protein